MLIVVLPCILVALALWMVCVWLGAQWVKVPAASARRVFVAAGAVLFAQCAVMVLWSFLPEQAPRPPMFPGEPPQLVWERAAGELIVIGVLTLVVLKKALRTNLRKAAVVWLFNIAGNLAVTALFLLVVQPFLFEGYRCSSNAMAPTLLGRHRTATCPRCGGQAFASLDDWDQELVAGRPPEPVICRACRRSSLVRSRDIAPTVHPADRILVDKLSSPRRWDVIVYRYPEDRSVVYVSRLVGFPGETVSLREGSVWINGRKQALPPALAGLRYASEPGLASRRGQDPAATADEPLGPVREWSLGADEYFVLGDFSERARDSRTRDVSAQTDGETGDALTRSDILGVVSSIYWPPARWARLP
jgi:signal peptidase I